MRFALSASRVASLGWVVVVSVLVSWSHSGMVTPVQGYPIGGRGHHFSKLPTLHHQQSNYFAHINKGHLVAADKFALFTSPSSDSKDHSPAPVPPAIAKATFFISAINLLKNCVGSGVFSLNSRVSKIVTTPEQYGVVGAMIMAMATWGVYNFYIIGETCRMTEAHTFSDAWSRAVSERSARIVQAVVTVAPIVSCIANTIVLTDVAKLLLRLAHAPMWVLDSRAVMVALLAATVLFPICTVRDLSALRSVSLVGLIGQVAAMAALAVRLVDGSYRSGGRYFDDFQRSLASSAASTVAPAATAAVSTSSWFVLASLLSYCFVTHYNAPRYFSELTPQDGDRFRFLKMAATAYGAAAGLYGLTIFLATALFGTRSASFALNNFSPRDPIAVLAFLAFGTSVLASFPLIFLNVRSFFLRQAQRVPGMAPFASVERITAMLLFGIGSVAVVCTDIGKVGALSGAVLGSSMMFIFPPIMYMGALKRQAALEHRAPPAGALVVNSVLLMCGVGMGAMGTFNSVKALFA